MPFCATWRPATDQVTGSICTLLVLPYRTIILIASNGSCVTYWHGAGGEHDSTGPPRSSYRRSFRMHFS